MEANKFCWRVRGVCGESAEKETDHYSLVMLLNLLHSRIQYSFELVEVRNFVISPESQEGSVFPEND